MIQLESVYEVFDDSLLLQIVFIVISAVVIQAIINTVVGIFVGRVVRGHKYRSETDAKKQIKTLKGVVRTTLGVVLWVVTALLVLRQAGVNLAALMTGAGLFGVIFGFGAQNVIKDFVAGLFVIGENQYRVGDVVEVLVGGQRISGTVEDLTIRITKLRDLDGNLHTVSNGSAQSVTNLSFKYANVNVDFRVAYDADIDQVQAIVNKIGEEIATDESWSAVVYEPIHFLRVAGFEESGVRVKALGKVEPAEQWAVAGEFRRRLLMTMKQVGVDFADTSHVTLSNES